MYSKHRFCRNFAAIGQTHGFYLAFSRVGGFFHSGEQGIGFLLGGRIFNSRDRVAAGQQQHGQTRGGQKFFHSSILLVNRRCRYDDFLRFPPSARRKRSGVFREKEYINDGFPSSAARDDFAKITDLRRHLPAADPAGREPADSADPPGDRSHR